MNKTNKEGKTDNKSSQSEIKKIVKKAVKTVTKLLVNLSIPIFIIVIAGAFAVGILEAVAEAIGEAIESIGDIFTVNESDGAIQINDVQIDTIINSIYEADIDPSDLGLLGDVNQERGISDAEYQEALRKYIREFYEAQVMTETLNYKHKDSTDDVTYGAVYVYRATSDNASENRQNLTYIPYEDMVNYQKDNNAIAKNYFSVDEEGNLVVAGTTETVVEKGEAEDKLSKDSDSESTTVTLRTLDYKTAISQYTTQVNFLIDLVMVSHNPEFVSAVVDLIKDSRIEITITDKVSKREHVEILKYIPMRKWVEHKIVMGTTPGQTTVQDIPRREAGNPVTEVTKTTTTTTSPMFNITYVKTWFCEQEITYSKKTDGPTTGTPSAVPPYSETEPPEDEGEWKTEIATTIKDTITTEQYEESTRGNVKFTIGEKGDGKRYENKQIKEPTFVGLMETGFRIPNSDRYEEAGINLVSGADILFHLLQKDQKLQNMETIMRYALNKYTDSTKYGVTELDGSIFEIQSFLQYQGYSEYWWPIGSSTVTTEGGIDFAQETPVPSTITSGPGPRWGKNHNGLDIAAGRGTNIIAAKDGVVVLTMDGFGDGYYNSKDGGGFGNHIKIQHSDGTYTIYAHLLKDTIRVSVGDTVKQGQLIGQMGTSGSSTGVHLHFEMRDANNNILDPEEYVSQENPRPTGIDLDNIQQSTFSYLVARGMTEVGAAAILGNIQQESAFNPTIENSIGAFGLCQWLGGRKDALISYAESQGVNYTDPTIQLEFLWMEIDPSVEKTNGANQQISSNDFNNLLNATSIEEATRLFMEKFERCGSDEAMLNKRINYANQFYEAFARN